MTTCLENLDMSKNFTNVRDFSKNKENVRKLSEKKSPQKKLPKNFLKNCINRLFSSDVVSIKTSES